MALVKCEDCGKEISERAPSCIHCGAPRSVVLTPVVAVPKEPSAQTGFRHVTTRTFSNSPAGQRAKVTELNRLAGLGYKVDAETIEKGNYSGSDACCLALICPVLVFFTRRDVGSIHVTLSRWSDTPLEASPPKSMQSGTDKGDPVAALSGLGVLVGLGFLAAYPAQTMIVGLLLGGIGLYVWNKPSKNGSANPSTGAQRLRDVKWDDPQ